jgi:hypothetical protein
MIESRTVAVCVFHDPQGARDAIAALRDAGFENNDISLLTPDGGQTAVEGGRTSEPTAERAGDKGAKASEGAVTGALAGGLFGGLAGWLVGLGALAIPGVGPFVAAGALAAALGGAALGAGLGAIAGALVGMGVPEDEAKYYEQEVRGGRSLVAVRGGERAEEADQVMHRFGGYDARHPQPAPASGRSA